MRKFLLTTAAAVTGLGLTVGMPAEATVLLNLINPPYQIDTPFALSFAATASTTTISIAGYDGGNAEVLGQIGVFLGGVAPNVLAQTWTFTPAASGSASVQYNDGTSVNALIFGDIDSEYDTYSQTFATTPGSDYTLDFVFINYSPPTPSALMVTTTGAALTPEVPEPASMALLGAGVLGLGLLRCKRG